MLCQKCGLNEAEVHLIQTINGEKSDILLCGNCAFESSISPISFTNFIPGFMQSPMVQKDKECPACGLTLKELKQYGKAGCGNCYGVFGAQMEGILRNVQAGDRHTGRFPKRETQVSIGREILNLKKKLKAHIENEEFEQAAVVRDSIKKLEGGLANG